MMSEVHCFTSISLSYLDRARVLGTTLKKHHPDWVLWLCISDIDPHGLALDLSGDPFDHVVRVQDLDIHDFEQWAFGHDLVELCTAVKGVMLCRLLEQGGDKVVYLDPDIAVFGALDPVIDLLDRHSIVLTPHLTQPETSQSAILDNEVGSLKHGIYNLGFLGVRHSSEGVRFAGWWRDRLLAFCHDNVPGGLFTDQRWCDLIPALFEDFYILRDPGYNVAAWNLSHRPLAFDVDGTLRARDYPVRFVHFTKVSSVGEAMLERYANRRTEIFELLKWYRQQLAVHAVSGLRPGYWGFGSYRDGTPIRRIERVTYRSRPPLKERFPHPFDSGSGSFQAWCASNLT
ncbi:MAG: hypothetical protein JO108_35475 [Acidobacteriaceae bacterium]|nr:hypothetical protein [Acidobacteriaceae bacterium]